MALSQKAGTARFLTIPIFLGDESYEYTALLVHNLQRQNPT